MKTRHVHSISLSFLVLLGAGCDSHNTVVDAASVCSCRTERANISDPCFLKSRNWLHTVNNLMGVSAFDFENGGNVGTQCEGETGAAWEPQIFFYNSWRPVTGYKENMVGTLHHFNTASDEDWNLHVIPNAPFSYLITDVEAMYDESIDHHQDCGGPSCMEMEISPDKQFWNNPWFFQPGQHPSDVDGNGYSWLEGRELGYYGLWIMDANHDFKAEIHPANQMWFKDHFEGGFGNSGPFDIFWLLFMQDNTGRFDDEDNFDCGGWVGDNIPAGWKPWENGPRSGQFNIAFEVDPAHDVATFDINEIFKRFVVTGNDAAASADSDDGTTHALEFNGREVVKVNENQSNGNDLGVTFTNLCFSQTGRLRGFVTLKSKIGGNDDKDEEGFHILYVTRRVNTTGPVGPRPPLPELSPVILTLKSMDRTLTGSPTGFIAGFTVELIGDSSAGPEDRKIKAVELRSKRGSSSIAFEATGKGEAVVLRELPLKEGEQLWVTNASGKTFTTEVPAMVLSPLFGDEPLKARPDEGAWPLLLNTVGGQSDAKLTADRLVAYNEMGLRLVPAYAAIRGKEESGDWRPSYVMELDEAILKYDLELLKKVFGSESPFGVTWTAEATDLATGKSVPVYLDGKPHGDGVQIAFFKRLFDKDSVQVRFPEQDGNALIECTLHVLVTDARGNTRSIHRKLWSHGMEGFKDMQELVAQVAGMGGLGMDPSLLLSEKDPGNDQMQLVVDPRVRHARVVRGLLSSSMHDGRLSIAELKTLMKATAWMRR